MLSAAAVKTLVPSSWTSAPEPVLVSEALLISFTNSWSETMTPSLPVRSGPARLVVEPVMFSAPVANTVVPSN